MMPITKEKLQILVEQKVLDYDVEIYNKIVNGYNYHKNYSWLAYENNSILLYDYFLSKYGFTSYFTKNLIENYKIMFESRIIEHVEINNFFISVLTSDDCKLIKLNLSPELFRNYLHYILFYLHDKINIINGLKRLFINGYFENVITLNSIIINHENIDVYELIKCFVENGYDFAWNIVPARAQLKESKDSYGKNLIFSLCERFKPINCIEYLLSRGANLYVKDKYGHEIIGSLTGLSFETVELLVKYGIDIHRLNKNGRPLIAEIKYHLNNGYWTNDGLKKLELLEKFSKQQREISINILKEIGMIKDLINIVIGYIS